MTADPSRAATGDIVTHIAIRLAEPTDAPELPDIEHDAAQVFLSVEKLEWIADQPAGDPATYLDLVEARTVWVAVADGETCGFLAARVEDDGLHIVELSVRQAQQRRGVARALIERAAIEARRRSLSALTLTTFREVAWNAPFYAKLGFRMLDAAQLSTCLERQIEREAAAGLPRHRRCAMALQL